METTLPTTLAPETIRAAASLFNLEVLRSERLPGYADTNLLLMCEDGRRYVLKISPPGVDAALLEAQAAMLDHVAARRPHLHVPRFVRSREKRPIASLRTDDTDRLVCVVPYLDGCLYADFRPHTANLRRLLGRFLGELDASLVDFDTPALHRYLEWDPAQAADAAKATHNITDDERRRQIDRIFDNFARDVQPRLQDLRHSIIHCDANDYNILAATDERGAPSIAGLIDFGDAVHSATIANLAVAIAYGMMNTRDPLSAAADIIAGYHDAYPLEPAEIDLLYPLARTRLAMSATFSGRWRATHADGGYHTISETAVRELMVTLQSVSPNLARYTFRDACGLEACPKSASVTSYLDRITETIGPVLPDDLNLQDAAVFDLSVSSADAATAADIGTKKWTDSLFRKISDAGATVGIGRYDEPRACYVADQFVNDSGEPRTIHLGIDLFAPAGTRVLAPVKGVVHSLADNDLPLDYGPTVILEHIADNGKAFYTLYGHLSRTSISKLEPGHEIATGETIGALGDTAENGGWPPHLHLQLIVDMLGMSGNFPGVAAPSRRSLWTSISPDPNVLLKVPQVLIPDPTPSAKEVRDLRKKHFAHNLSLSYAEPLHIVRGVGRHLFDANGRSYLDCVNNVAHVGHCHPRVVAAIAEQAAVLNTNTRYLHDNLVRYAERLTATLPESLSVCFFVNSGSEANDLALRMARAHTGGSDVVVVGGAYHGHLSSLIDISPYKAEGPGGTGLPLHVHALSVPDRYRGRLADAGDIVTSASEELGNTLTDVLKTGKPLAAFICESALSCAGQIILPPGYLTSLYGHVREAGGVCIADEVQVGLGRMGTHFWGFQKQDVVPDIVTMGKPIGNGHPLAAVVTTREIADSFANGMEYFNTFGGNPVSCAAGLAVLDVLEEEGLQSRAQDVGSILIDRLRDLQREHRVVGDVRGAGLFIGIELSRGASKEPAGDLAAYVVNRLKNDHRMLLSTDGPNHNVIKFKPPMVFAEEDVEGVARALGDVLEDHYIRAATDP